MTFVILDHDDGDGSFAGHAVGFLQNGIGCKVQDGSAA
jgi:hypothetical protein